jgi:hypothetical protein
VKAAIRALLAEDVKRRFGSGRIVEDNLDGPMHGEPASGNLRDTQPDSWLDGCVQASQTLPQDKAQLTGAKLLVSRPRAHAACAAAA